MTPETREIFNEVLADIKKFADAIIDDPKTEQLEFKLAQDLNCSIMFYNRLKECECKIKDELNEKTNTHS